VCIGTVIMWVRYNTTAAKTWRVIVYSARHPGWPDRSRPGVHPQARLVLAGLRDAPGLPGPIRAVHDCDRIVRDVVRALQRAGGLRSPGPARRRAAVPHGPASGWLAGPVRSAGGPARWDAAGSPRPYAPGTGAHSCAG
jgi:hypothetical protein